MADTAPRKVPPFLTAHDRLLIALALGLCFYALLLLPGIDRFIPGAAMHLALAWDVVAGTYLLLAVVMMRHPDQTRIRLRAKMVDIGIGEIVTIVVLAAGFSLIAVGKVLAGARGLQVPEQVAHIGIGVVTVVLSWLALHTLFAVHYAHLYYDPAEHGQKATERGGLDFPGEKQPDYWDFLYFSVVIGMTCQVSDVTVSARDMRHLVTAQGIIAFFYNTVILALAVNIAAGLG
ncbi:MAG TPA: DUF1345 domain-containing protein [Candidatus Cybelea sp.]|nr:DUF1345 domain-containing protein [Candidatus Cybelea sp.]